MQERNRFHRALRLFGWGRWHAIRTAARLQGRSILQIKLFAKVYMQVGGGVVSLWVSV
jgi:hypothetical protein